MVRARWSAGSSSSPGVRFVAVTAEMDNRLGAATAANLPNVVHARRVEDVHGDIFKEVLSRRRFDAILVGGGPPCQGNSTLNPARQGAQDPRTQEASHLARIVKEIESIAGDVPVLKLLENVASAPLDSKDFYSSIVGVPQSKSMPECGAGSSERGHFGCPAQMTTWTRSSRSSPQGLQW